MSRSVSTTNEEMAKFHEALTSIDQDFAEKDYRKFKYAVAKTLSLMKDPIAELRDKLTYKDPLGMSAEYNQKYQDMFNENSVDENGEPFFAKNPSTSENVRAVPLAKRAAFQAKVVALNEEYKDLVDDVKNHQNVAQKLLLKNTTFSVFCVNLNEVPESLPQGVFNIIHHMIDAEEK